MAQAPGRVDRKLHEPSPGQDGQGVDSDAYQLISEAMGLAGALGCGLQLGHPFAEGWVQ